MTSTAAIAVDDPLVYRRTVWRLLLPIAILTFINGIDRLNVSFAGQALSSSIGLSPSQFGMGVSAFFVAYLLFQYPHAALLRRIGMARWLLLSVMVWGLAGVLMSHVHSQTDFLIARFVLGIAESGFAPGMTWYISRWTLSANRARAMAMALSAVPMSLVIGGPLCGALLGMVNPLQLEPWRWMFLVSALSNFIVAVIAAAYFVDRPSQAKWLPEGVGQRLEAAIANERSAATPVAALAISVRWSDPRIAVCAAAWLMVMTGSYALVYWLPQIVRQMAMAHSEWLIGTLSALPQAGLMAGLFLNARHSDRSGERLLHTAAGAALAGVALIAAVVLDNTALILTLLVVAGFGLGAAQGVFWTLPATLGIGAGQVPVGVIAAISMAGTAGGVIGPWLLGHLREMTGTHQSGILCLAAPLLGAAALLVYWHRRTLSKVAHD